MKKLFLAIYVVALVMALPSCESYQAIGDCDGAYIIAKPSKDGRVYGIRWEDEAALPPSFLFFGEGIGSGTVYFSNDKKVCYLFSSLPTFWLGLLMLLVFAVQLGWFPIGFAFCA